ncbi:CLUMA_CG003073, isoform A [Clunio marinus]|uniref:CLUMA_CG003073, isoform A n=1 Tax=Clunio marinus TaxID=568069 RepID=A0A1J1HP55_9DIPT|nr:CLUMA_CG003073, isoform A [Clunio marinus]
MAIETLTWNIKHLKSPHSMISHNDVIKASSINYVFVQCIQPFNDDKLNFPKMLSNLQIIDIKFAVMSVENSCIQHELCFAHLAALKWNA